MKPSVILYAVFLTVSLGIKAQQVDTVSYEVTKNMPVFYEQLKQQLTYPAAWGKSTTKDFGKWRNTKYSDGVHAESATCSLEIRYVCRRNRAAGGI